MRSRTHDLEGNMFASGSVSRQPDSREVAPPEFSDHHIAAIVIQFPDCHRMITTLAVILGVFFIRSCLSGFFGTGRRGARTMPGLLIRSGVDVRGSTILSA